MWRRLICREERLSCCRYNVSLLGFFRPHLRFVPSSDLLEQSPQEEEMFADCFEGFTWRSKVYWLCCKGAVVDCGRLQA